MQHFDIEAAMNAIGAARAREVHKTAADLVLSIGGKLEAIRARCDDLHKTRFPSEAALEAVGNAYLEADKRHRETAKVLANAKSTRDRRAASLRSRITRAFGRRDKVLLDLDGRVETASAKLALAGAEVEKASDIVVVTTAYRDRVYPAESANVRAELDRLSLAATALTAARNSIHLIDEGEPLTIAAAIGKSGMAKPTDKPSKKWKSAHERRTSSDTTPENDRRLLDGVAATSVLSSAAASMG